MTLPIGYTCEKCVIRLLRQASEWGQNYRFWSCADVTILPHPNASSASCANLSTPVTTNSSSQPSPHSEPESEPTAESEPYGEPEPTAEPEPRAEPEASGEPTNSSMPYNSSSEICLPVSALEFNECYEGKCLNGGDCNNATGLCNCRRLFSGERCEEYGKLAFPSTCNLLLSVLT